MGGERRMAVVAGWVRTSRKGDRLVVAAGGSWVVATAAALDGPLRAVDAVDARTVVIDLAAIETLDTAGAWLVVRTQRALQSLDLTVAVENLEPTFAPLLEQVAQNVVDGPPDMQPPPRRFGDFVARIGRVTLAQLTGGAALVGFIGLVFVTTLRTIRHPSRLRLTALFSHMEQAGVNSLPVVGLLSFLVGIVFAFQGADQLRRFGAEIYTVNLLGVSILRELGVLLTAIILAGRSGSAFTAQIGTMKVNEEVDAMQVLGLDPIEVLVLPRLFAMMLTLPLVAFFANVMGMLGGAIMAWISLDITIPGFLRQLRSALSGWTFWVGVLKAPTFAGIIALTGCYEGLRVSRSAESVGRLTTRSVVESIFLIILADAVFSIIFSYLKI
jgi:phospholipid/cholesterol/gamma-HCH transport system permease protein